MPFTAYQKRAPKRNGSRLDKSHLYTNKNVQKTRSEKWPYDDEDQNEDCSSDEDDNWERSGVAKPHVTKYRGCTFGLYGFMLTLLFAWIVLDYISQINSWAHIPGHWVMTPILLFSFIVMVIGINNLRIIYKDEDGTPAKKLRAYKAHNYLAVFGAFLFAFGSVFTYVYRNNEPDSRFQYSNYTAGESGNFFQMFGSLLLLLPFYIQLFDTENSSEMHAFDILLPSKPPGVPHDQDELTNKTKKKEAEAEERGRQKAMAQAKAEYEKKLQSQKEATELTSVSKNNPPQPAGGKKKTNKYKRSKSAYPRVQNYK